MNRDGAEILSAPVHAENRKNKREENSE